MIHVDVFSPWNGNDPPNLAREVFAEIKIFLSTHLGTISHRNALTEWLDDRRAGMPTTYIRIWADEASSIEGIGHSLVSMRIPIQIVRQPITFLAGS